MRPHFAGVFLGRKHQAAQPRFLYNGSMIHRAARAALASWLLASSVFSPALAADVARIAPEVPLSGPPALAAPLARFDLLVRSVPALSLAPASAPDAAKLTALAVRARELAPAAAVAAPVAAPAATAVPAAAPDAKLLLEAAGRALKDVSVDDIRTMPPDFLHAFVGRLLGEYDASAAAVSAPVPAAAFASAATAPAGEETDGLLDLLRSPAKTKAFIASFGPEYASVDAERFAREAKAVYGSVAGSTRSRSIATVRAAAAEEATTARAARAAERRMELLADLPRLTAEGMVRSRIFFQSAAATRALQRRDAWPTDADGAAVADVAVVGAGPAGLATGIHSVAAGLKTVMFEAGFVAQSFSDAAMKPIYRMRTPASRNSLLQAPFSPSELVASLGMLPRLRLYRARGQLADDALFAATRRPPLGAERTNLGPDDASVPSARNELLQHFSDVAGEIVRRGGVLLERTGVDGVRKRPDGLWELRGSDGRVQLARQLVLAQGQVGVDSQFGNFGRDVEHLALAHPDVYLTLRDRRALQTKSKEVAALLHDQRGGRRSLRRLIVHDALLGAPEVERSLRLLPAGTRVGIVGSGESAVKAAMAVLRQNPSVHVELFTQGELQTNQLQIPAKHVDPEFIGQALNDSKLADECVRQWQAYGVPVTPATISDLKAQAAAGHLTIHPLGRKLIMGLEGENDDSATVTVRVRSDGTRTFLQIFDAGASGRLIADLDGPIVSAVGYSRRALRQDPLTRQLVEQGRLKFKAVPGKSLENEFVLDGAHPLSSALDQDLYVIGAQNYGISADSTIPGAAARAAVTVEHIRARLAALPPVRAPFVAAAARRLTPVASFIGGLTMIEAALDARGTVLPTLVDGHYGHGQALAFIAVAYNLAGIIGRQAGGVLLGSLGLRKGYALSLGLRAAVFAALGVLLALGMLPLWSLLALVGLDGFLYGAAYTAETVAPARLVGQDQRALERLSMWQQLLLPVVAFAVPVATGALVSAFGFVPVLAAVPVLFAAAAVWFGATLKLTPLQDHTPSPSKGFLASIDHGARAAFSTPALRTAFAGYILFNLLSPLLYVMISPTYALRVTTSPEAATEVFGWQAGLYSVGWLLAGLVMSGEQRRLAAGAEAARFLKNSVLRWMNWGAVALIALGTFAFSPQTLGGLYALPAWLGWASGLTLPALALIPFGLAQVLASVKLRSFFQSRLPAAAATDGMAFLGAASLGAVTLGILALKFLFAGFSGMTPFALMVTGLPVLAAVYVWLARRLRRETAGRE
jgi:hypothetical protein